MFSMKQEVNIKWEEMKKTTKLENPVDITEHLILRRLIFTINWKNNRIVRAWQTHKSVSYSQKFTKITLDKHKY